MITLYSGTPGSGKSLHLANDIWIKLRVGKNIIANFPINTDLVKGNRKQIGKFTYVSMPELTVDFLTQYAYQNHVRNKENQTLLIIDECAVIFNSRAWDSKERMKWIVFFQQHRKLGYNVILVAQQDRMIDRQIRGFIEYEEKHRCVNNYKIIGQLVGLLSMGKMFVSVQYWYGLRERIGAEFLRLNRRKASIYDTFLIFSSDKPEQTGVRSGAEGGSLSGLAYQTNKV